MGNDDGEIGGIKEEEEVGSLKGMAKRDQGTSRDGRGRGRSENRGLSYKKRRFKRPKVWDVWDVWDV